ncbi:Wd Repeat-Containing And Planar Cell Polarity Effector Protein Fritz [Manis pentadactyla]|nr:Wd Repeat-Containing And Planar Cell Polarity Effector Protein Fritz [Manis pentadactyla]
MASSNWREPRQMRSPNHSHGTPTRAVATDQVRRCRDAPSEVARGCASSPLRRQCRNVMCASRVVFLFPGADLLGRCRRSRGSVSVQSRQQSSEGLRVLKFAPPPRFKMQLF